MSVDPVITRNQSATPPATPPATPLGTSSPDAWRQALAGACVFSGEQLPTPLPENPFAVLTDWLGLAVRTKSQPNPNSMALATVDERGWPHNRIVLARDIDPQVGVVTFYTNYLSAKGKEIAGNNKVACCFHWDHLDRQVRVEGLVLRAPESQSDAYFATRPVMSRVAAWASDQSMPLASRDELLARNAKVEASYGISENAPPPNDLHVQRPPHWGGFRLFATAVELWLGHQHRLHDRARYERGLTPASLDGVPSFVPGAWTVSRLMP